MYSIFISDAEYTNKELIKYSEKVDYCKSYQTNLMCKMSSWHQEGEECVDKVIDYAKMVIEKEYNVDVNNCSAWIARYDIEDYAKRHNHHPCPFSFVYFINTPKGSAPLCFDEKEIKAEAGKLVIFEGRELHHVPKNQCENRLVMAGNIFTTS